MDPYSSYPSSNNSFYSSSSSYSSSYSASDSSTQFRREERNGKPQAGYKSALHSVRRVPGKHVITKKPIAPMPPTPPKIYKVKPADFKDVVQRLTGAVQFQTTRLRQVAPPPLSLSPRRPVPLVHPSVNMPLPGEAQEEEKPRRSMEGVFGGLSPLGFSLSPASLAWCSSILFSPGTLSPYGARAVL